MQDASILRKGQIEQDFYAAFGLGLDDRRISAVDADGVASARAQALYRMLLQIEEEIQKQQSKSASCRRQCRS